MWDLIFNRNKKHLPNYFSFSQISSFEMCPMQYKLIYIDGIKRKYESIESYMGKRVHSVLEWLYKPENKEKIINFDRICEEYDKDWVDKWNSNIFVVNVKYNRKEKKYEFPLLSEKELERKHNLFYSIGKECLSNYYKDFYPFDQSVFGRELELTFNVREYDKNSEPKFDKVSGDCIKEGSAIKEYPFKGIIERIDKPYEKKWEIHDYKTGKRSKNYSQLKNDFQLALYQIGVKENFKDVGEINLIWHSLRHNTNITISHNDKQLYRLEKKIVSIIKKIKKSITNLENFKPKPDHEKSTICNWCPVWEKCEAKTGLPNPSFNNLITINKK